MQGAVQLLHNLWSPLCNVSEYVEGLQRCLEKCGVQYARSYSDTMCQLSWYDLPSPSLPTSSHLQPHPPPLHLFHLHPAPTPMHTCATCTTTSHPLSD